MAAKYWASSVIGGVTGSLDNLNPLNTNGASKLLAVGDVCKVEEDHMISTYKARSTASMTESFPDVIIPDTNPGDWWWELINRKPRDEGMVTAILYANTPGAF